MLSKTLSLMTIKLSKRTVPIDNPIDTGNGV